MLLGEVNTIIDREEGKEVKFYQVDSYLVDLQTNDEGLGRPDEDQEVRRPQGLQAVGAP